MNNNRNFNRAVCAAVHKMRPGETLYSVARSYNTDLQRLMILNGIKDPHNIAVGQEICIPHAGNTNGNNDISMRPGAPSPGGPQRPLKRTHTIATGDTLYGISRNYGVSLASLMSCNPGIDPYDLQVGAKLNIPETRSPGILKPATPVPRSSDVTDDAPDSAETDTSAESGAAVLTGNNTTAADTTPITLNEFDETPIRSSALLSDENDNTHPHAAHYYNNSSAQTNEFNNGSDQNTPRHTVNADGIIHTVSKDETLTDILTRYGICYHAILHENPGTDFTKDMTGLSICIPYDDIFARSPENQPYIVKSGDTLITISETTGTPSDDLLRMNPCCNILHFSTPGTRLRV